MKSPLVAYLYRLKESDKPMRLQHPLVLEPSSIIQYFEEEEPLNLLAYLKSPYFMMIGVSVGMMYMMKSLPKEEMEQMQA